MQLQRKKKNNKINLIPIMDAVFIFIFFLLMSAQFVKIHEIASTTPKVSPTKNDKEPLNLKVKITETEVTLSRGTKEKQFAQYKIEDTAQMSQDIVKLKSQFPDEHTATIFPLKTIKYKQVVKVVDAIRVNDQGLKKGFSKIVFSGGN